MTETALAAARKDRGTLFVEDGEVAEIHVFPDEQYVYRLKAPQCARHALPGSFVHIQCDAELPMRRPLSIMRANSEKGWIDLLFKVVGEGLRLFSRKEPGDRMSLIGPIGQPFEAHAERPHTLLIGGGVGIPPMIFLAEYLKDDRKDWQPLVLMGSEIPFPFDLEKSDISCDWLPDETDGAMPLLEQWNIPNRLASLSDFHGCYRGLVTDLADRYLASLATGQLGETEVFACGPTPMLEAVARLASQYRLPCQVALEEFMACGVGGCAGCTVLVQTPKGPEMKRVCVDGPVFDATAVFPAAE